jgi:hypothetical protein
VKGASMDIEIFTLCDFAQDMNRKLVIVGTFDTIFAHDVPAVHPTFSIAFRIRFDSKTENGKHTFKISFVNPDGKEFIPPVDGEFNVEVPPETESGIANFSISVVQFNLTAYGKYSVILALDGKEQKSLPLYIRKSP